MFQIARKDLPFNSKRKKRAIEAELVSFAAQRQKYQNHLEDMRREHWFGHTMILRHLQLDPVHEDVQNFNERFVKVVAYDDQGDAGVFFLLELLPLEDLSVHQKIRKNHVPDPRKNKCCATQPGYEEDKHANALVPLVSAEKAAQKQKEVALCEEREPNIMAKDRSGVRRKNKSSFDLRLSPANLVQAGQQWIRDEIRWRRDTMGIPRLRDLMEDGLSLRTSFLKTTYRAEDGIGRNVLSATKCFEATLIRMFNDYCNGKGLLQGAQKMRCTKSMLRVGGEVAPGYSVSKIEMSDPGWNARSAITGCVGDGYICFEEFDCVQEGICPLCEESLWPPLSKEKSERKKTKDSSSPCSTAGAAPSSSSPASKGQEWRGKYPLIFLRADARAHGFLNSAQRLKFLRDDLWRPPGTPFHQ